MHDMTYELWHNPRCSKSREAKKILDDEGVDYRERRYLDDGPSPDEMAVLLTALGMKPWELVRKKDARKLDVDLEALGEDESAWINAFVAHPRIIERPILIAGTQAVVGRPPERVRELL